MVTAATRGKRSFFDTACRLTRVQNALFEISSEFGWDLHAWSVFANHYHFVAGSPDDAGTLRPFLSKLHANTARELNRDQRMPGRKVWFEFWDTHLSFKPSYLARLNYTHHNPVKHGLVSDAQNYPWCSAAWFAENATPAFRRTVENFKTDRLNVPDDFSAALECGAPAPLWTTSPGSSPPHNAFHGAPGRAG